MLGGRDFGVRRVQGTLLTCLVLNGCATDMPGSMIDDTPAVEFDTVLLDDLEDGDARFFLPGIAGEWFTYSDGTSAVTPPDHSGLGTIEGEAHIFGEGFSDWGVGVSAFMTGPADLSAYAGLRVRLRGSGTLVAELVTPATAPAAEGGTCVGEGCFGHFATTLALTEAYQDHDILFDDLEQPEWAQVATLDVQRVLALNLVSKVDDDPAAIDVWLDEVVLLTELPPN